MFAGRYPNLYSIKNDELKDDSDERYIEYAKENNIQLSIYDEAPEDGFWTTWSFVQGDGTKYEKAMDTPFYIVASFVDKMIADHKKSKEK